MHYINIPEQLDGTW